MSIVNRYRSAQFLMMIDDDGERLLVGILTRIPPPPPPPPSQIDPRGCSNALEFRSTKFRRITGWDTCPGHVHLEENKSRGISEKEIGEQRNKGREAATIEDLFQRC